MGSVSTTMVAVAAVGALVAAGGAGWVRDRLRGRSAPHRRVCEGEARYLRDGGDPTHGYDQASGGGLP
jgi:hypothetical protein